MTPVARRFVLAANAAARGTMNRIRMMQETQQFLILPAGSVRSYQFLHTSAFNNRIASEAHIDTCDDIRAEVRMSPKRSYGTTVDMPEYVGRAAIHSSFQEDYDHWNMHRAAAHATSCDLGQLYDGETPAATNIFATTLMGNNVRLGDHSTFFEHDDDYYAKFERALGISDIDDDAMIGDGDDYE